MDKSKLIVVLALCVIITSFIVGFAVASGRATIVPPVTKQTLSTPKPLR